MDLPISIGVSSKNFNLIAVPLILMLKTTRLSKVLTFKMLEANVDQVVDGDGGLVKSENPKFIEYIE